MSCPEQTLPQQPKLTHSRNATRNKADLLKVVLTHNYFQFADRMYHQVQGTAMGTKMATAYANLFMAERTPPQNLPPSPHFILYLLCSTIAGAM